MQMVRGEKRREERAPGKIRRVIMQADIFAVHTCTLGRL